MTIERHNKCQFCGKTFLRKAWFLRHSCKKKKQFEETNDIVVQQAFRVYAYWAKKTKVLPANRVPKMESFLKSNLKTPFVNMMMYTREHGIMSPYTYVDWIIAKRITQKDWVNEERLDEFKTFIGEHESPLDHAEITLREIEKWLMDDEERIPNDFFDYLTPGTILTLLRQGRIKPWVLFAYPPVRDKWLGETDNTYNAEVYHRIDDMVNCPYWAEKFVNEPDGETTVIEVMSRLWESQT